MKHAFKQAVDVYGLGSGSSPLVSGYYQSQRDFEESFADFVQRDKALFFNSGYHANLSVFQTLTNRHGAIFSDKYCHASLLDGIQLSRARHIRYPHHDMDSLEERLKKEVDTEAIVVTESIFSMHGDVSDLTRLSVVCKENNAFLCLDDAHGLGVLGESGRGACEYFGLSPQDVPCLIHPLGKAFGGMGAMVSGSHTLIDALVQQSRTYRYSTMLPPAIAAASLAVLEVLRSESWRRDVLHQNIALFNQLANEYGIPLCSYDLTPIRSVVVGSNDHALGVYHKLLAKNYFVSCIRPPTVPENTARLRISLCSEHSEDNIRALMQDLAITYHESIRS
ncbi:MAG: 8-amino-7-oxononanoate synthase [Gammaproteobacteria bacterium]|nr:8-amino-7-oxononanoate synthase [Gammaproteobacteria bacterium]